MQEELITTNAKVTFVGKDEKHGGFLSYVTLKNRLVDVTK